MNKHKSIIVCVIALSALLLHGCGMKHSSDGSPGINTVVTTTLLKSSLAEQIDRVILQVVMNDVPIYTDTTAIQNGNFSFESFQLPTGHASFFLYAVNNSSETIYTGETMAAISGGVNYVVHIELLPAIPMVKLSPYCSSIPSGDEFTSTLELFNISRFFNGSFKIFYDPSQITFNDTVSQADPAWGDLLTFSHNLDDTTLVLSVTRTGDIAGSDAVEDGVYSLVNIAFKVIGGADIELRLLVDRLEDLQGPVAESVYPDGQTIYAVPFTTNE